MPEIRPIGSRILVEPKEAETKTAQGLVIPDTAKDSPLEGKVLAVGDFYGKEKLLVNVGDTIIFQSYSYETVERNGKKYFIMKQDSILAVIKNEK